MSDETKTKRINPTAPRTPPNFRVHPDHVPGDMSGVRRIQSPGATGPLVRAVVRDGRCLDMPDETAAKEQCGYSVVDKEYVFRQPTRRFGPGSIVELPRSEVERLTELGFLVDPTAAEIPVSKTGMPS